MVRLFGYTRVEHWTACRLKTLEIDKTFCKQFSEKGHFDKIWP